VKKYLFILTSFVLITCGYLLLKSAYTKPIKSLDSITTHETLPVSDTFIETKATFAYQDQKIQYMLIVPAAYTQDSNQWPLILFLHGSSLRGNNLDLVKEYGPTWVSEQRSDFPFVVLAPQCPENADWINMSDIITALLTDVLKKYRIDKNRVYLTGISLGGRGAWILARKHPEYFAAFAPIAAATQTIPDNWDNKLLSLPIWAFHGDKDTVVPLENDTALIDAFRKQGGTPRFTILHGQGHYIAGIYKNRELYDWFLSKARQ
jgi:predicted peptidase